MALCLTLLRDSKPKGDVSVPCSQLRRIPRISKNVCRIIWLLFWEMGCMYALASKPIFMCLCRVTTFSLLRSWQLSLWSQVGLQPFELSSK